MTTTVKDPKTRTKGDEGLKEPSMFLAVLLNDDFTPMDFVIALLVEVFHHTQDQASKLMWDVHTKGKAIAGRYTFEICETKVAMVLALAKKHGHPLQAVVERE